MDRLEGTYQDAEPTPHPDMYEQVRKFNAEVVGPEVDRTELGPNEPPFRELLLGVKLLYEEVREMMAAVGFDIKEFDEAVLFRPHSPIDHAQALDGAMDIEYVLFGLLLRLGYPRELVYAAWHEVTRANMAKAGGPTREDGKRLKPEGWTPPDIASLVAAHTPIQADPVGLLRRLQEDLQDATGIENDSQEG